MAELNIFEYATRHKLRFPYKGSVSAEDLWDLNLTQLDGIFKTLNAEAKQASEESLLSSRSPANTKLDVQIAVIRHIVATKQVEASLREQSAVRKQEREKILSIMAAKQDAELQNKSLDELAKMLAGLEDTV